MRGTVCAFVCTGFHAAREPSAKSTRNDSDDPPWFSFSRVTGCVRMAIEQQLVRHAEEGARGGASDRPPHRRCRPRAPVAGAATEVGVRTVAVARLARDGRRGPPRTACTARGTTQPTAATPSDATISSATR